jgi:hypothetical protein
MPFSPALVGYTAVFRCVNAGTILLSNPNTAVSYIFYDMHVLLYWPHERASFIMETGRLTDPVPSRKVMSLLTYTFY